MMEVIKSSDGLKYEWSVKDAIDLFFKDGKKDGDLLSHEWILYALDLRAPQSREEQFLLLERMDSFRNALLKEHCIALENVRGQGYRVVPPWEQAEFSVKTMIYYIDKGIKKGSDLLKYTRKDRLSHIESKRHTDCEIRVAGLKRIMTKNKRDLLYEFVSDKK